MRTHPLAKQLRAARDVDAREVRVVRDPKLPKPQCATEVSAGYRTTTDLDTMPDRHFVVFCRDGGVQRYPTLSHELYEPLHYPLLHPHGTVGWWAKTGEMYDDARGRAMTLIWYSRQRLFREWIIQACGRLLNEWLVDSFCRIDDTRLQYLATPEGQRKLRVAEKGDVEHYCDDIEAGTGTADDKPGRVLLPSSHTGSKRQMYTLLQNVLSARKRKATFFDTMTCNPKWEEIVRELLPEIGRAHV